MKVNSICTNSNFSKRNVNFGSSDNRSGGYWKVYALMTAACWASCAGMYKCTHDVLEESRKNFDKISNQAELRFDLYDVKRDTLDLKDVNGDDFPELILYKNDGSAVVVDISNGKSLK